MTEICAVCHREFNSLSRRTICDACYDRIVRNMELGPEGICPVCGNPSGHTRYGRRKKYCSDECYKIGHMVCTRRYNLLHRDWLQQRKKERRKKKKIRLLRGRSRIDDIAMLGKILEKIYGEMSAILRQRAARDGISLDIALAAVVHERGISR